MLEVISVYFGSFVLVLTEILFARIILSKKEIASRKTTILVIVIISIIYTVNYILLDDSTYRTLINCVAHVLMFKYLFNITYGKSILTTFIYVVLLLIPDMFTLLMTTEVLGVDKIYYYEIFAGSFIANLVVSCLLLGITYLLKKPLRKLMSYRLEQEKLILFYSALTLICVLIFFYTVISNVRVDDSIVGYLIAIAVFLAIISSLYKQKIDNNNLVIEYDKLLDFMKVYEKEIESQRILRHESKNQLLTIKGKIVDEDKKSETIKYIDSVLKDNEREFNKEKYAKYQYLPANGLKALFYFKTEEAEELGINVDINVSSKIDNSFLSDLTSNNFKELGKIIGIYLDNAIEASSLSSNKLMGIEIYKQKEDVVVIISNTYVGNIDIKKIGNHSFSTKGRNRGHGLMLVKNITTNNNIFESHTEVTDKLYIQKLIIKKHSTKK